ncbi:MAG: STAS domain-containing protein [Coriobacteriia bacterium]|nr:STAS domain-containing protein [Coriobacteriia bacterium]
MALDIQKTVDGGNVTLALGGRLDTATSPELEAVLDEVLPGATDLVFDLEKLEFISSSGLRLILRAQKTMNTQGSMRLTHVCDAVMEIFDITGFMDFLVIE